MGPSARPRVRFVAFEASRTGSPALLLRLLRWAVGAGRIDADVVCWRDGPLAAELSRVAPTRVLAPATRRSFLETAAVGVSELGLPALGRRVDEARVRLALRGADDVDVLYLNGVPSFVALPALAAPGVPVLGHVHELEFALGRSLPAGEEGLLGRPDRYVAVSQAVADNLVGRHGVASDRVAVHRGFVDDRIAPGSTPPSALRRRLGAPDDAPVVGAVGDLIWRKGPDLFLALGAALAKRTGRAGAAHLVWVGGAPGRGAWAETTTDRALRGLDGRVHLVGEQAHPEDWYGLLDLLVLPAREDPFPLVALEAAQRGLPVVAFDQGGVPELLAPPGEAPAGIVVPPLDVEALADAVDALLEDPAAATALGVVGAARVAERHVTSVAAPALVDEIEALR